MAIYVWSLLKLPYAGEKSMVEADMAVGLVHTSVRWQRLRLHVSTGVIEPRPRFAMVQAWV